ncbi:hypothetical protein LTR37_005670 [Vermiconidia calcicola]|uniref:Uncharacterized protein n=1 Tax=Vermiconidia calcicola TaxID=1690605 RepID=A0ACC3NI95_9PEZI|nr:hypothetical protein LTR37_005670 [Vermiconidia calcicola]
MTQYIPPAYQQPRPDARTRGSSSASMNKYVPDNYRAAGPPPPTQDVYATSLPPPAPDAYSGPPPRPRGPSIAGQPIISTPPVPNLGSYGPSPSIPIQQWPARPGYPDTPGSQLSQSYPPSIGPDDNMRPLRDQRRLSAVSAHSRRSHRSHHSHNSPPSHRSRRSSDRERRSHDKDRKKKYADSKHSDDETEYKVKRTKTHRPTWGDSLFSMFGVVKGALGPRDKY